MKSFLFVSFIHAMLLGSCKSQNTRVIITQYPIFSEVDTFVTSTGHTVVDKDDYFLVSGNLKDKRKLRTAIDSFVKNNYGKECGNYGNYLMFFYKRSSAVNEKTIKNRDSIYRYRVFLYNRDRDFIASFDCWNSIPSDSVDFQPRYK